MIINLFRKNRDIKKHMDTRETEDVVNTGVKKKSLGRRVGSSVLVILLLGGLGFAGSYFYFIEGNKKSSHVPVRFSNVPPESNIGSNAWLSGQSTPPPAPSRQAVMPQAVLRPGPLKAAVVAPPPIPAPVEIAEKKGQKAGVDVKVVKEDGRDVFKEFYFKHPLAGQSSSKSATKTLDKTLQKVLSGVGNPSNGGFQELPMVHAVNTPVSDPLKQVEIYGTTCMGGSGCVAITSEGTLHKGDKIGVETVQSVTRSSLATDKRMVELQ